MLIGIVGIVEYILAKRKASSRISKRSSGFNFMKHLNILQQILLFYYWSRQSQATFRKLSKFYKQKIYKI